MHYSINFNWISIKSYVRIRLSLQSKLVLVSIGYRNTIIMIGREDQNHWASSKYISLIVFSTNLFFLPEDLSAKWRYGQHNLAFQTNFNINQSSDSFLLVDSIIKTPTSPQHNLNKVNLTRVRFGTNMTLNQKPPPPPISPETLLY